MALNSYECTPNLDGTTARGCGSFCDSKFSEVHCSFCSCSSCSFCSSRNTLALLTQHLSAAEEAHPSPNGHAVPSLRPLPPPPPAPQRLAASAQPLSEITYPTTYPIPETQIVAPPLPWMRAACMGKCLASCNPSRGSDCDTCQCRGCPYCLVLKKRPPRHEGHALPTIDDCGWLSSMHDLRTKDSFCFSMHNTSRLQCESYVTSTGRHGVEDGMQCASNVMKCFWHRCSERRFAPSNASQPSQQIQASLRSQTALANRVCCDLLTFALLHGSLDSGRAQLLRW